MTPKEHNRLMAYHYAQTHRPSMAKSISGRRFVKGNGKAVGQRFIKGAREIHEVSLERIFK